MSRPGLFRDVCPHCGADLDEKPPTRDQRGYWYGVLVDGLMTKHGHATRAEAHDALVRSITTLPWDKIRPSTANGKITREDFSDLIERACAYLVVDLGIDVPDPDPDPVSRWERAS